MEIEIKYFGMLAEITGLATEHLTVDPDLSVGALRERIQAQYPAIGTRKYKVAVNLQISGDDVYITPQSEVALLPPFAGG